LKLSYEDQILTLPTDQPFDIGREADLSLDNNPFLHRQFLRIVYEYGFWWLVNIGTVLSATVSDSRTGTQAWLGPGARLPVSFGDQLVIFTAGPCVYELRLMLERPLWQENVVFPPIHGDTTLGALALTEAQRLVVVALAEPMLRRETTGLIHLPTNAEAAQRIGWGVKRFNRKVDNVCDKLDRFGVDGLRGGVQSHATGRRARLVEWACSTGLVSSADLVMLDRAKAAQLADGSPEPDED
jgi:hypothetical protein